MADNKGKEIIQATTHKVLKQATEGYSESMWLRALVSLIPTIGGTLDVLLTHKHNEIVQRRIEKLLNTLGAEVEKLQSNKIDRDYLESEEWHDLFFVALERTSRIKDQERIEAIARILRDAITKDFSPPIHPVDLVQILGELSDQEAFVLARVNLLYDSHKELLTGSENTLFTEKSLTTLMPEHLHASLRLLLSRLIGKGLLDNSFEYYAITSAAKLLLGYFRL